MKVKSEPWERGFLLRPILGHSDYLDNAITVLKASRRRMKNTVI